MSIVERFPLLDGAGAGRAARGGSLTQGPPTLTLTVAHKLDFVPAYLSTCLFNVYLNLQLTKPET